MSVKKELKRFRAEHFYRNEQEFWYIVSEQEPSEEFIRKYADKLDWHKLCFQSLSEDLIRDYADKVDWCMISDHQVLSKSFVKEFINKINLEPRETP